MRYFPLFIDLENKRVTVIGGGTIAARRIKTLLQFGCRIKVVAVDAADSIKGYANQGLIEWEQRPCRESDCEGNALILAATDDRQLNHQIFLAARERGILVNTCDRKEECDFYFPGIVTDGDTVIGITCNGRNHKLARETREKIAALIAARKK